MVLLNLARHRCSWHTELSLYSDNSKKEGFLKKNPRSFNDYRLLFRLVSMGTTIGWLSDMSLNNNAFYCYNKECMNIAPGTFLPTFNKPFLSD